MKRYICEDCMKDYETERNNGVPFPSFTVLGGITGTIAGLATGLVVLVPAGLLAGLAADVLRCEECGSDKNVYEVMIEKDDEWGTKIYRSVHDFLNENPRHYRYDELEGRFTLIEDADPFMETPQFDVLIPDLSVDYDVSFDTGDASLQVGPSGPEMGGSGEGGSGEGGSSGGSASGGGNGGGE